SLFPSIGFTPSAFRSLLNCEYTAAAQRHLSVTPGWSTANRPLHVIGPTPPGNRTGTGKVSPSRKELTASLSGTVVRHGLVAASKTALAHVTVLVVWHWPVDGLHASVVHALLSLQVTAAPLMHWPAVQTSPTVHPFPSLHVVPFGFAGLEQTPVDGLHVPASWH